MKAPPPNKPLDLFMVQSHTASNRDYIEIAARRAAYCEADTKRDQRLAARECSWCFYHRGSMCGQGFTDWTCWSCGAEENHPNTCVPRLCNTCSDKLGLCVRCCADIELKHRKVLGRKP